MDRLQRVSKTRVHTGGAHAVTCSASRCTLTAATRRHLRKADRRLHRLSWHRPVEEDPNLPLLLYRPVDIARASATVAPDLLAITGERRAYEVQFTHHYFLADAQHIFRTYFPQKRDGFFIEVGGLNGKSDGSNSLFFERYLNWRGLMVEASPQNFASLFTRRPLAWRLEAALDAKTNVLNFSGHGCCGKVAGIGGGYRVRAVPIGHILRAMGVQRVDFWSLDVRPSCLLFFVQLKQHTLTRGVLHRLRVPSYRCSKEWIGASTCPFFSSRP